MEWRVCDRFPAYEVNECGQVRRRYDAVRGGHKAGQLLRPTIGSDGYPRHALTRDGKKYSVKCHKLVVEAFIGPKPFDGAEVCHGDSNKLNYHISNLRWDTKQANADDYAAAIKAGLYPHRERVEPPPALGEANGQSKLTEDDIKSIRYLVRNGQRQVDIAKSFALARSTVSEIVNHKSWTHVV